MTPEERQAHYESMVRLYELMMGRSFKFPEPKKKENKIGGEIVNE